MKTIRCFLAVNLSVETSRVLAQEQRRMREACERQGGRIRWVPPQNMHVTIRFLGQITEPMVAALRYALERTTRAFSPFETVARGIGVFPDESGPRVLWAGVASPDGALIRLYDSVSGVLEDTGFKLESKPFRSHATIGRIKEDCPSQAIAAIVEEWREASFGTTLVRDLVCYRSDLRARGADYHLLWRLPLAGRPPRSADPTRIEPARAAPFNEPDEPEGPQDETTETGEAPDDEELK